MKHLVVFGLLISLILIVGGCTGTRYSVKDPSARGSGRPTHYEVSMLEFHFRPESLNVRVGDTVTWVNHGRLPHTTTSGIDGKPVLSTSEGCSGHLHEYDERGLESRTTCLGRDGEAAKEEEGVAVTTMTWGVP